MVRFGGAMAGLPVWGSKKRHTKNREIGGAQDQPRIGRSDNGDVSVEARGRESAWGDTVPLFGASN